MRHFDAIDDTRRWVREAQAAGRRVGIVPTMGALHDGHLSLVAAARRDCDNVVATVFLNPTQFAPGEDLDRYPRDLAADARMLSEAGADTLFAPSQATMYPPGSATAVDVGPIGLVLEGAARPTHFRGVATVVLKLLQIAPADRAYFGRKDYQQTVVVRRMVKDLCLPIDVVVCPTVREPDGLAMSSRNAYLTAGERRSALALSAGLALGERLFAGGERAAERIRAAVRARIADAPGVELEYAELLVDGTLDAAQRVDGPTVLAVAGRVGGTRLIDNTLLDPGAGS